MLKKKNLSWHCELQSRWVPAVLHVTTHFRKRRTQLNDFKMQINILTSKADPNSRKMHYTPFYKSEAVSKSKHKLQSHKEHPACLFLFGFFVHYKPNTANFFQKVSSDAMQIFQDSRSLGTGTAHRVEQVAHMLQGYFTGQCLNLAWGHLLHIFSLLSPSLSCPVRIKDKNIPKIFLKDLQPLLPLVRAQLCQPHRTWHSKQARTELRRKRRRGAKCAVTFTTERHFAAIMSTLQTLQLLCITTGRLQFVHLRIASTV